MVRFLAGKDVTKTWEMRDGFIAIPLMGGVVIQMRIKIGKKAMNMIGSLRCVEVI